MLEMVVQPGGTAPAAQISGYRVGGKTGTAQKLEGGRYSRRYVASFVGIAPMSDPRLVIAVMVDEPSGKEYYGGQVAGPVFGQIASGALRALGVAPDAPLVPLQVAQRKRRGAHVSQAAIQLLERMRAQGKPRRPECRFEKRGAWRGVSCVSGAAQRRAALHC